jgi:hypothetical protein
MNNVSLIIVTILVGLTLSCVSTSKGKYKSFCTDRRSLSRGVSCLN